MERLLGMDIGGTKCAVLVGTAAGETLERREFPTPDGPEAGLEALTKVGLELAGKHGAPEAVGISCGGPLDAERGVILSPPNLPGWDEVRISERLSASFGVPAFLQNDADAGALAEWKFGAGRGCEDMMFCTMGTGFGAGLILGGRLVTGANGNAGEIGHIRLTEEGPEGYHKEGSVEGWCSGGGIAKLAGLRLGRRMSAKDLALAAAGGDTAAQSLYAEVGGMLGRALAMTIDLLNLERIILGGIFGRAEPLLRPSMERVLEAECLPAAWAVCEVRAAELGERIGDVAALTVAWKGLEKRK